MKNPTLRFTLIFSLLALTLFACTLTTSVATPTADLGPAQTTIAETLTAVPVNALPTSMPVLTDTPALVLPTLTSVPTAAGPTITLPPGPSQSGGSDMRIKFAMDATSGIQEGSLMPGQSQRFVLGASADQPLEVSVDSLNHDITFSVTGVKDGKVLVSAADKTTSWQTDGMLTVTQDYLIELYGGASTENFTLNVITPARIRFAEGAISGTYSGSTPGGWTVSYILRAKAGQKMHLDLTAPGGNAVLAMYGYQDGQPYLRYVVEQTSFDFTLPATEDYIIQVVPRGGEVAKYTLKVQVK